MSAKMQRFAVRFLLFIFMCQASHAWCATIFFEGESITPLTDGWRVDTGYYLARTASMMAAVHGAYASQNSSISKVVKITEPGMCRIHVRYLQSYYTRGPFKVSAIAEGKEIASKVMDATIKEPNIDLDYVWDNFDADLPAGDVTLVFTKIPGQPFYHYTYGIDCVMLTTDLKAAPDHRPYGPQMYVRIHIGKGHEKPFYIHIFGNYYRAPWYGHYALSRNGLEANVSPSSSDSFFTNGETTSWLNITNLMYFDSGVNLWLSPRYAYADIAPHMDVTFEFATAPDEKAIIYRFQRDIHGSMRIIVPPYFNKPRDARFVTDLELAEKYGLIADAMKWPAYGKTPEEFPFFISANLPVENSSYSPAVPKYDQATFDREWKTLDYFGFSNKIKIAHGSGVWNAGARKNYSCYTGVDTAAIRSTAKSEADLFFKAGKKVKDIAYCMTMDEPGGAPVEHLKTCPVCLEQFRAWLKELKKTPSDLLVKDWDAVKFADDTRRDSEPALYYWTQKFRTRAYARFMRLQREALEEAYGGTFPVNTNFSDGAVYIANFLCTGIDYFDLLDSDDVNAIWSEDWVNGSSTRQCGSYNTELMCSAAMKRNQHIGSYLIWYGGRTPWNLKAYTASHAARNCKTFSAYWYGPVWSSHEAGPPWGNFSIQARTEIWPAAAEIVREIGGAEDLLYPARKARSEVAILYSSSTDFWTYGKNYSYGFDRMHTWLSLAHEQISVDILSEKMVEEGALDKYRVCYFSGPNLTQAAAEKLSLWVKRGGVLVVTAGAGMRDEYNRPMKTLEDIMPATRSEPETFGAYLNCGRYIYSLQPKGAVTMRKDGAKIPVLSVRQTLNPKPDSMVLGVFDDGTAAYVKKSAGRGVVYCQGFLPALTYMWEAERAYNDVWDSINKAGIKYEDIHLPAPDEVASDTQLARRTGDPWDFPAGIRGIINAPVYEAKLVLPVRCSVPLVDAVLMESAKGAVVPLSNYTCQPQKEIVLTVKTAKPVTQVVSVRRGKLAFKNIGGNCVTFSMPLLETDFVKLYY